MLTEENFQKFLATYERVKDLPMGNPERTLLAARYQRELVVTPRGIESLERRYGLRLVEVDLDPEDEGKKKSPIVRPPLDLGLTIWNDSVNSLLENHLIEQLLEKRVVGIVEAHKSMQHDIAEYSNMHAFWYGIAVGLAPE